MPAARFRVVALAVKRSPKRLKYATPRFTKVIVVQMSSLSLFFGTSVLRNFDEAKLEEFVLSVDRGLDFCCLALELLENERLIWIGGY